jgi:hypothetical protein
VIGLGYSVHVGVRAVPDDVLVSSLLLIGPLWKSGDITVWRSGGAFVDLSPVLAEALQTGRIESAAILEGISEPASRWVATKWSGALVVDAECFDVATFDRWTETAHYGDEDLTLVVLSPDRVLRPDRVSHPAGKGLCGSENRRPGC